MSRKVHFQDLGLLDYKDCWDYQEKIFKETIDLKIQKRKGEVEESVQTQNHLLFVEHPPVFTLGKSGDSKHLLLNREGLADNNISYYEINRGGDITFHGPGQIVGYPIFDLDHFFTDIHKYLRFLEEAVILTLSEYGIQGSRIDGLTGVWLDPEDPVRARKICALGVKCSRWVTMHGFAFNVNTHLDYFNHIIPCGISDKAVTSMAKEKGHELPFEEVKEKLKLNLANVFDFDWELESHVNNP